MTVRVLWDKEGNITVFCSIKSVASAFLFIIKVTRTFQRALFHAPNGQRFVYTPVEKMSHQYFWSTFQGEKDYLMHILAKCVFCLLEMSKVVVIFCTNVK